MIAEKKEAVDNLLMMVEELVVGNDVNRHYAIMSIKNYAASTFSEKEIFLLKILHPRLQEYL